ncbi:aminotransferase class I/II-fold pyridoxal phosphate-dependent enzyme [Halalkaliarchaeum sp. AArc-GB]|uniref:O-acetylhomoserine aminocarboxypropyltransferase/cysteine synthase family protein n=1 Tax=unclassified Halalkaliarchaeum TaxID=2678344 RepID=UPI00217EBFC1|nr:MULTISPECIES: aminotransferase class I/II-fold pyridoxal phosphate-dependent enzyme [unclassified Halalkaliarchaeum]MDR5673089.1 aminotransferase class I/II-fold pyridoxal phosphate-dependent enzyme [Halalkaliarchaeum sp. AArc-GB]
MTRGFRTESLHAGAAPDPATGARATPIYRTTSYEFGDADTAADLYALRTDGDVYSRISNPTVRTLASRLATLEGGVGCVATASGMAAIDSITTVLARTGDNVVAAAEMYGGTSTYFRTIASRRGVDVRLVDPCSYDEYAAAIDDDTAFVHVETIANPSLLTPDLERLADVAHEHAVPLVVDNTFATPALCRPLEHGADVVWESTTKWLHGGGTTVGGVVVDGGTFPWDHPEADYPELSGENPAFDVDFAERFGDAALTHVLRHRALRILGNGQSPDDAWQTLQGIETLPLRMDRHCENAVIVAEELQDDPRVDWVSYPGLPEHPTHDNAERYLDGFGGMVTFGLSAGQAAARRFCESVELASFLANVGDSKTLVIHPASTTHAQLTPDEQREAGVPPDMVRLSVGIEDPADILGDIDAGLREATE